jgi:hypothetical protein
MASMKTVQAIGTAVALTAPELPANFDALPEMTRRQIIIQARHKRMEPQAYLDEARATQARAKERAATNDAVDEAIARRLGR